MVFVFKFAQTGEQTWDVSIWFSFIFFHNTAELQQLPWLKIAKLQIIDGILRFYVFFFQKIACDTKRSIDISVRDHLFSNALPLSYSSSQNWNLLNY